MSFFGKIGGAIKHGVQQVGGLAEKAAPILGGIPGVGTIAGGAIGGLGALAHGDGLKGALKYGLEGAASGFGGGLLKGTSAGGSFLSKVGNVLGNAGGQVKDALGSTFMPGGKLDFGKIAAAGGAGMNLIGQAKQRKSATNYNNAAIDQRNKLMESILAPTNYNLPKISPSPNLNEQASMGSY